MDSERFDRIAKTMATSGSRRRALGLVLAGGIATALGGFRAKDASAATCKVVTPTRVYTRAEVKQIIRDAAIQYGQNADEMLTVAKCESNFVPTAYNASGPYYGLFQFLCSTFKDFTPYDNRNLYNPKANALAAAYMWSKGYQNHWSCYCMHYRC